MKLEDIPEELVNKIFNDGINSSNIPDLSFSQLRVYKDSQLMIGLGQEVENYESRSKMAVESLVRYWKTLKELRDTYPNRPHFQGTVETLLEIAKETLPEELFNEIYEE